jgi:hypothetical protein
MKNHGLLPFGYRVALVLTTFLYCLSGTVTHAAITATVSSPVRQLPAGIGGVGIFAHDNYFATDRDSIPYRSDLATAGIYLVRTVTYPDFKATSHTLSYFDNNVAQIQASGGTPLFIQYFKPNTMLLKADGTTGGTLESNMVYLVNRYKSAPYNITTQYWEMHNEPDGSVDYQMTPAAYAAQFNSMHDALVAAGLRSNVILCGPATMSDYGWGATSTDMMNTFLDTCKNSVDVVTRHIYIADPTSESNQLNDVNRLDAQWDVYTPNSAHGEALLQQTMNTKGVPSTVMTGITEYNVPNAQNNVIIYQHTLTQGLWNLIALSHCSYNPRSALTTGFIFDSYGTQTGGLGYYDTSKVRDYAWWAHYIHGVLRGNVVLARSSTNKKLVTTVTRDNDYLYFEVINRDVTNAITDSVTITDADVDQARLYQLSATVNTLTATTSSLTQTGASFTYTFPAKSVSIFRYPYTTISPHSIGFETTQSYSAGVSLGNCYRWSGTPNLLTISATGGNSGQCALSAPSTSTISAFSNVNTSAIAADFNGSSAPISAGFTGVVKGSFDVAVAQNATTSGTSSSWFFRFGGANQCEFFILANRTLQIRSSAGSFLALDSSGSPLVLGSDYVRIQFVIDYATQTSRIKVNGVQQHTTANATDIPWYQSSTNPAFTYVRIQNNQSPTSTSYVQIKVDNITYGQSAHY